MGFFNFGRQENSGNQKREPIVDSSKKIVEEAIDKKIDDLNKDIDEQAEILKNEPSVNLLEESYSSEFMDAENKINKDNKDIFRLLEEKEHLIDRAPNDISPDSKESLN